jgi:hypothetical protein
MLTLLFKQLMLWLGFRSTTNQILANKEESVREKGRLLQVELSQYINQQFKANIAGLVHFKCIRSNIISLTELIIELNNALKEGIVLSASRCYFTDEAVTISSFFEKDNRYISHSKIFDYCKVIEEFYVLTKVLEEATVGTEEHNYRMLTKVFVSLKDVNAGLLEVLTHKD